MPLSIPKQNKKGFMKIFYLVTLLALFNSIQYPQWVQTNGPSGGDVSAIVSSGLEMYASTGQIAGFGYGSGVYKSTDNGLTWKSIDYPVVNREDKNVSSVTVSGDFIAFGAQKGLVMISHDKGITWTRTFAGSEAITGLVTDGTNLFAATNGSGVYATPLISTSWAKVNTGLTNKKITSLQLAGTTLYVTVLGGGQIFSSTNNGANWTASLLPSAVFNTYNSILANNKLYVGTQNGVYYSPDNGATWVGPISGFSYSSNAFAISGTTLFAGNSSGLYSMPLSGGNFTTVTTQFGVLSLLADPSGLWTGTQGTFASYGKGLLLSTNNGVSWSQANSGLAGSTIQTLFPFGDKIFAVKNPTGLYSSTDKGATWILSDARASSYDALVQLVAEKNGKLFVAANNGIITSSDTGKTWDFLTTGFTPQALFVYGSKLFAGEQGGVRISTDDGVSWAQANNGLTGYLSANCFASNNGKLFLGLYGDGVYTSIDSGTTWTEASTGLSSRRIRSFAFIGNLALVGTDGGGVNKSTDAGLTWTASNAGLSSENIWSLTSTGGKVFVGSNDGVHISYDSAATWQKTSPWPMISNTLCVTATDIYDGTYYAGVWRKSLSEFVTDVKENSQISFKSFSVEQNYPNPFNPVTTISFSLANSGFVNLSVFNMIGEEVATLVNKNYQTGNYTVEFNANDLPSGIYLYRLSAGNFVSTKKMILMK